MSVDTLHNPRHTLEPFRVTLVQYYTLKGCRHSTKTRSHRAQQPPFFTRTSAQPPQLLSPTLHTHTLSWPPLHRWQPLHMSHAALYQLLQPPPQIDDNSQTHPHNILQTPNHTPTCNPSNILLPLPTEPYLLTQTKHTKHTHQNYQKLNHQALTLTPHQKTFTFKPKTHRTHTHTPHSIPIYPQKMTQTRYQQKQVDRNQNYVKNNVYKIHNYQIQFQLLQNTSTPKYTASYLQYIPTTNYSKNITATNYSKLTFLRKTTNQSTWIIVTNLSYTLQLYITHSQISSTPKTTLKELLQRYTPTTFTKTETNS